MAAGCYIAKATALVMTNQLRVGSVRFNVEDGSERGHVREMVATLIHMLVQPARAPML